MKECSRCGVTWDEYNGWLRCKKTGEYICWHCCKTCELHKNFSGIWKCLHQSAEDKRRLIAEAKEEEFRREVRATSEAYWNKRREERKRNAVVENKRRKK